MKCILPGCNHELYRVSGEAWVCRSCWKKWRNEDGTIPTWLHSFIRFAKSQNVRDRAFAEHELPLSRVYPDTD